MRAGPNCGPKYSRMSVLSGEMTKQIFSAPPITIRSRRYSLTARGRSHPFSDLLPTGSSSFENPSGWMRLPRPAAGTMPHMSHLPDGESFLQWRPARLLNRVEQNRGAAVGRMFGERTLARGHGDAPQLGIAQFERRNNIIGRANHQDLLPFRVKGRESIPIIRHDRHSAG